MDWSLYWFMFPVAMMVSMTAMMFGIGGAALFMPLYIIIFPLLGPDYPFDSVTTAALVSLITMCFSFASGVSVYAYKRCIDYKASFHFLKISVPVAFIAAWMAQFLVDWVVLILYSSLVLWVAWDLIRAHSAVYKNDANTPNILLTSFGAFTTGAASVGIGEVIVPQLLKMTIKTKMIAGTSVFVVFITVLISSLMTGFQLWQSPDVDIPWNVICYTVPGVLIGAQMGSRLQGKISRDIMNTCVAVLFFFIAIAMVCVSIGKALNG